MHNKYNLVVFFIFFLFLILGISIYDDYGISWDEYDSRITGFVSLNFVRKYFFLQTYPNFPKLENYIYSNYGVIFSLPMAFLEKTLQIEDSKHFFLLRHFFNFIIFFK